MVRVKKTYFSDVKPRDPNCVWLKPVSGGFAAYVIDGGNERPLKVVDDNGTTKEGDDTIAKTTAATKTELIGSIQDAKTANTINGAKAYAKDAADAAADAVVGTSSDTSADLTLNGLKAYIDEQIAGLE